MSTERPVLVLLHGVGLDHTVWDRVAPLLEATYDVRCPDLPGHGAGVRVPSDVNLRGLTDLVSPDVPDGAHVVGFSLGSLIAQDLAARRTGRVASLVCVSSVCRRTPEEREAVLSRLSAARSDHAGSVAASIDRWYAGTDVPAGTVERTREVLLANDLEQYLACYRVFATGDVEVYPVLAAIDAPCLAVTGSDDPGSTPGMSRRLAAVVPDCRVEIVPGARHMLPVQCPEVLAQLIHEFIGGRIHA
jgi:pimeloyl-ACP methyl ester carboxylesterase